MSRWELTDEVKEKYLPVIQELIKQIEESDNTEEIYKDFSDTKLNPYTLKELVCSLGYEDNDGMDTNGWEMDFWIYLNKDGCKTLCLSGTGITFELKLGAA